MTCQEKKPETKSFLSKLIHPSAPSSNISTAASTPSSHALATCLPLTRASFATVSSIYTIGALLGALASGPFASRRGRVSTQRLIAFFFLVGSAIEAAAPTPLVLGGGRFLAGIGGGAATVVVPLYISEVAPPAARGVFGAATQVGINVGILITQTEGFFFNMDGQWRWILATGAALALVQAMGLALAVESPAWIAGASGDGGRARRMLQRIRGTGADVEEETRAWGGTGAGNSEAEALLANGHEAPEGPTHGKAHLGFVQVVRNPLYRPAIVAVVGVMFAQQVSLSPVMTS